MGRFLNMIRHSTAEKLRPEELSVGAKEAKNAKKGNVTPREGGLEASMELVRTPENAWEWIEERSAIIEIEGGMSREQADYRAFELWYRQFIEDDGGIAR